VNDFELFGYGDKHLKEAGLKHSEVDVTNFEEKYFYTFRKSHTVDESHFT